MPNRRVNSAILVPIRFREWHKRVELPRILTFLRWVQFRDYSRATSRVFRSKNLVLNRTNYLEVFSNMKSNPCIYDLPSE